MQAMNNGFDLHLLFEGASACISLGAIYVGLAIRNAILGVERKIDSVASRIDVHVAEDRLIHQEVHRRLEHIERFERTS